MELVNATIKCTNLGCPWEGERKYYKEHVLTCRFALISCPNQQFGCMEQTPATCNWCGTKVLDFEKHTISCRSQLLRIDKELEQARHGETDGRSLETKLSNGSAIQASASPQQHQSIPVYQRSQAPSYPYSLAQPSCNIYICTQPAAGNLQTRPQSSYLTAAADFGGKQRVVRATCDDEDQEPNGDAESTFPRGIEPCVKRWPFPKIHQSRNSEFPHSYRMDKYPHGLAVIINNEKFKTKKYREGSRKDEGSLLDTFQHLGYIVRVYRDCTKERIENIMKSISQEDHSQYDSFVCCILSHGTDLGEIYSVDEKFFLIDDIAEENFNANCCGSLAGKPKIFFVQACRGNKKDEGARIEEDSGVTIPSAADFFFGYATPKGATAYRDCDYGSWYVFELSSVFNEHFHSLSLLQMMMEVHHNVARKYEIKCTKYKQAPEFACRLTKEVFF